MPLTDTQIRNSSTPAGRVLKLSDGQGLQLWVTPSGAKLWNLAYQFGGKQRKLAIGPYPRVSLKDARMRRDEAKRQLDAGIDPSQQKRLAKLTATAQNSNTFAAIADELLAQKRREGKSPATLSKMEWLFGLAKPAIGARPIPLRRPRYCRCCVASRLVTGLKPPAACALSSAPYSASPSPPGAHRMIRPEHCAAR